MSARFGRRQLLGAALAGSGAAAAAAVVPGVASAAPAGLASYPQAPARPVRPGADVAAADGWSVLRGARVGVVSNPTGILLDTSHVVDALHDSGAVDVRAVFGPEHGFRGSAQAGGSEGTGTDARTGLTVYDAYGANATKFAALFDKADVDTLVFDIQDVGARFYTYIWTMYAAQLACARTGRRFVVLDRPNPVGGRAYGPMMTPAYTSGVGAKEVVQQHGMTVGELARFFDGEMIPAEAEGKAAGVEVVEVQGWRRDVLAQDLDLPWAPPSPNMPTPDTALVYPGTGMFEGTNLSEGRGTTRPFELIGAPFADWRWSVALEALDLPGVHFREAYFVPSFSKHTGVTCNGTQVMVHDHAAYDPIRTAVHMLVEARRLYPQFAWRKDSWDTARPYWVDKLSGSTRLRTMVDAGSSADDVVAAWSEELAAFERQREPYLLYRGPVAS